MQGQGKHKHKLGVVIPVYKLREIYLEQCVESVLDQDNLDLEIVLVDDCSPDDCGKLCEEYAAKDSRIKVVHHDVNKGLPEARNTGLEHINSEWVSFVDGDDWVDPKSFSLLMNRIEHLDKRPDFVMFPGCLSYKDKIVFDGEYSEKEWRTKKDMNELQVLALSMPLKVYPNRAVAFDTAWAKIISYDYLNKNGILFRDLPYREDGMFFQELLEYSEYVVQFPIGMYHYRMTEGSMVHSFRPKAPEEQLKYLNMLWDFAQKNEKNSQYYDALYASTLVSMQVCITCFFYHKNNKAISERKRECLEFFEQEPYREVFKHVKFGELKRNFLIKAVLIYTKNYHLLNIMREYYMKNNNYICFE